MLANLTSGYLVSDGDLVLHLGPAEEGGYVVTSPLDPELVTEAETLEECFVMARDAIETMREARRILRERARQATAAMA